MTNREKVLYHHIHRLKLLIDWSAGCISFYLLCRRHRPRAVPPAGGASRPGRSGTHGIERTGPLGRSRVAEVVGVRPVRQGLYDPLDAGVRFAGNVAMSLGAWYRRPGVLALGLLIILCRLSWLPWSSVRKILTFFARMTTVATTTGTG